MRITDLSSVTNEELLASFKIVLRTEASALAQMLIHLIEIEQRRLHLEMACPSMYVFCTTKLGLSEGTATRRIQAARLVRRFPRLLDAIASGRIHLSAVLRLHDFFTEGSVDELLDAAAGKSKREVEEIVARLAPKPPVVPSITVVPQQRMLSSEPSALPPPVAVNAQARGGSKVSPLSEAHYRLELTLDAGTLERLEYARSLMRHKNPSGDLGVVFAEALEAVIETMEREKLGKASRPRAPRGTKDPATVTQAARREVVRRDGYQCSFISADGARCPSTDFLEFDHIVPRAQGGRGDASNLRLRCRGHNQYAAEQAFGRELVERETQRKRREEPTTGATRATVQKVLVGMGFRTGDAERVLGRFGPESWSRPIEVLLRDALAVLT